MALSFSLELVLVVLETCHRRGNVKTDGRQYLAALVRLHALFIVVVLCSVAQASADVITVGNWSAVPAANNDGAPFWDNKSLDGKACNQGHLLDGGAKCGSNSSLNLSGLEYLSDGFGSASAFGFSGPVGAFEVAFEISGWKNSSLGWYDLDNPSSSGSIFGPSAAPGSTSSVGSLPERWGFRFDSNGGQYNSTATSTFDQFSLFRQVLGGQTNYFLGVEDIRIAAGIPNDRDYNDLVVRFNQQPHSVPEPGTLALMGLGAVVMFRSRKRAVQ